MRVFAAALLMLALVAASDASCLVRPGSLVNQSLSTGATCLHGSWTLFGCECIKGWTGPECAQRQCINLNGTKAPHVGLPDAHGTCGRCLPGFYGTDCQLCSRQGDPCATEEGLFCDVGFNLDTVSRRFGCIVAPGFLTGNMSTDGSAEAWFDWTGHHKNAWANWYDRTGVSGLSVFRYTASSGPQPWLECFGSKGAGFAADDYTPALYGPIPEFVRSARQTLHWMMLAFCGVLVVCGAPLGVFRQVRPVLMLIFMGLLVGSFLIFGYFAAFTTRPLRAPSSTTIRRDWMTKNKCRCSPESQSAGNLVRCQDSQLGKQLSGLSDTQLLLGCNVGSHDCTFSLGPDTGNLKCQASQCVPRAQLPVIDTATVEVQTAAIGTTCGFVALLCAATLAHWLFSHFRAKKLAREFHTIYDRAHYTTHHDEAGPGSTSGSRFFTAGSYHSSATLLSLRWGGYRVPAEPVLGAGSRLRTFCSGETASDGLWKQILSDINFSVRSGEVLALMGSSGAGKTTLLDLIAQHAKDGDVSGQLCVNNDVIDGDNRWIYKRITGFVAQHDTLLPALTVRQSVRHAARLKLPAPFSDTVIDDLVSEMLGTLHLRRCADTVIGSTSGARGISGGERRRVSIAMELIANPRILLLDEPTSGLDSVNAYVVMKAVCNLARRMPRSQYRGFFAYQPVVIFSIHQPSTDVFRLFDKLLVLSKGNVLYFGAAAQALQHTSNLLEVDPARHVGRNPAEVLLEMHYESTPERKALLRDNPSPPEVNAAESPSCTPRSHCATPPPERSRANTTGSLQSPNATPPTEHVLLAAQDALKYYPNVWQQLSVLSRRTRDSLLGSYYLVTSHVGVTLVLSLLMMYLYKNEPLTLDGTVDKAGLVTFTLLIVGFCSLSVLDLFIAERPLFAAERENGYYATFPYFVAKVLYDFIPLRIVPVSVLAAVCYFPMGLRDNNDSAYLWFVFVIVCFSLFTTSVCLCVGMIAPSFGAGALFGAVIVLWQALFGGLLIQPDTIPEFLRWCKYLSAFHYSFDALMINELKGRECIFRVDRSNGAPQGPPVNVDCLRYLYHLGVDPNSFRRDISLLTAMFVGTLLLSLMLLAFAVRHRR